MPYNNKQELVTASPAERNGDMRSGEQQGEGGVSGHLKDDLHLQSRGSRRGVRGEESGPGERSTHPFLVNLVWSLRPRNSFSFST